jgi:hypothetical protein
MPNKPAVPCLTLYGSAALSLLLSGGVRAAEPDDFRVRTAADLVSLCGRSDDPNYVPAIHFCHGFGTGAYQYYQAVTPRRLPRVAPSSSALSIG